jgi:hypothetical protein
MGIIVFIIIVVTVVIVAINAYNKPQNNTPQVSAPEPPKHTATAHNRVTSSGMTMSTLEYTRYLKAEYIKGVNESHLRRLVQNNDVLFRTFTGRNAHLMPPTLLMQLDFILSYWLAQKGTAGHIVEKTAKSETFFKNLELYREALTALVDFEPYFPFYKPIPTDELKIISSGQYTADFLKRWSQNTVAEIGKLKTEQARQKKLHAEIDYVMEKLGEKVPEIVSDTLYQLPILSLLNSESTEETVKQIDKGKIEKPKRVFNLAEERELLAKLKSATSIEDKHFAYHFLIDFYYKLRDTDEKYMQMCLEYCREDIKLLPSLKFHTTDSKYSLAELGTKLGELAAAGITEEKDFPPELFEQIEVEEDFTGYILSLDRLILYHERKKEIDKAIEYSEMALDFYRKNNSPYAVKEEKRLSRLKKKELNAVPK